MTKSERELREYQSVFCDEKYAKKAWKQLIGAALDSSGKSLPTTYDPKTGEMTFQSQLDEQAYKTVKERLKAQGLDREPTEAELIVQNNILRARFNDTAFNTMLDRTAGKVKDEISVTPNAYEELSDDELEALLAYRESKENNKKEE